MNRSRKLETTSTALHILAMAFMLCDHLWGTAILNGEWLTCVGRLAFPIFAFLLVEGYCHTSDFRKYLLRMLLFAVLSEIPFNLAIGGSLFYPYHQNVLWSFLLSLLLMHWNESVREKRLPVRGAVGCASVLVGAVIGLAAMLDYFHAGVLTVLVFYFLRKNTWWCRLGQLVCLCYINLEILGGLVYELTLFGHPIALPQQSFALLSLIFIWLYRGRQGYRSKFLQYFCYLFYPMHLLLLG